MAIQDMQIMVNHRQVGKQRRRTVFILERRKLARDVLNESSLGQSESPGMWYFSLTVLQGVLISWVVAGQGKKKILLGSVR